MTFFPSAHPNNSGDAKDPKFCQVVAVDSDFGVFTRAWCMVPWRSDARRGPLGIVGYRWTMRKSRRSSRYVDQNEK